MCGFTPDDLYIGPHVLQSCYCCTTCLYRVRHVTAVRRICMYLACIMYTECSCSVCCYCCCGSYFIATAACCYFPPSSAGWQKMLLCNLIPVRYFSSFKHDCFFYVPLGSTVAFTTSICPHYYTSSVIAGMRGAKAGVRRPRRSPPCIILFYDVFLLPFCCSRQKARLTALFP